MMATLTNKALVLDLVEWVAHKPRAYANVMDAWRTSYRRLTIWEDAVDLGFVARTFRAPEGAMVETTAPGRAFLASERRD
jgi:hypothetical protein